MALGFLLRRRAPSVMSRKRAAGSISAFSSPSCPPITAPPLLHLPAYLRRPSPPPRELQGGLKFLTLARHLASAAAERVHANAETRQGGCGPQGELWGAPGGRDPDEFRGDGHGSSPQNVGGFHHGNNGEAAFRGRGDVGRGNPDGYHRGGPPNLGGFGGGNPGDAARDVYLDGLSSRGQRGADGFQRGAAQGDSIGTPQSSQWNPSGYGGGNPRKAYGGDLNTSSLGKYDDTEWNSNFRGGKQLDQGNWVFPESSPGEIQPNMGGKCDARPADESVEVAGSNNFKGTVDELDGFLEEDKVKEAVEVLRLLEKQGMVLDLPRYLKLMEVCGDAKAPEEARFVHDHILKAMGNLEVKVHNRILDMYRKCGSMDDAYQWFDKMPGRNFTSWETMIMGLADNGLGEDAIDLFNRFLQMGLKPDGHMFIAVFHVCSVLGAVDEGMLHFESMSKVHGIMPTMEHYASIVDMFGQTGYLDEALEFIEMIPTEPSVDVWETLMNCCRLQGNVELGDRCAEIVGLLDSSKLTNQSKAGLLPAKDSDLAKQKEKKKANILEVRSKVHEYRAGDTSHPENDRIYGLIRGLATTLRESGYVPDTRFVLHDIDQESKEEALLAHSERLATAYGLISSAARSPIRIIKNLRICGDCHSYMKIVSKLVGRELIIRDAKRFHHFKDGLCSCRDYW